MKAKTNLTPAEKKKLDNIVNKLNKRAINLAKRGMAESNTYKEITTQMQMFKASFRNHQIQTVFGGKAPASGTAGKIQEAVSYKTVYTPDGTSVMVPQISRSSAVLAFAKQSSTIQNAMDAGTGLAERIAMMNMLSEIYDGMPLDDDSLQMALEQQSMRTSMQDYAWDMLYGLKNIEEVRSFLEDEMTGKHYSDDEAGEAEAKADNDKALALYTKYASNVNKDEARKRPMTRQAHAWVWGVQDKKKGQYTEGLAPQAAAALAQAVKDGNMIAAVREAERYLGYSKATAGYAGEGTVTMYKPSEQEIMDLIEWMKGDLN